MVPEARTNGYTTGDRPPNSPIFCARRRWAASSAYSAFRSRFQPPRSPWSLALRQPLRGVRLSPASYPLHIVEEYVAAGGFVLWAQSELGAALTMGEFIGWNVFAFGLLCLGAWLVTCDARLRWVEIAIAVALAGSAVGHVFCSAITSAYSPGLATGVLPWVTLSIARGVTAFRTSRRRGRRAGLLVGVAAVLVPLAVLGAEFTCGNGGGPRYGWPLASAHPAAAILVGSWGTPAAGNHEETAFGAGTKLTKALPLRRS